MLKVGLACISPFCGLCDAMVLCSIGGVGIGIFFVFVCLVAVSSFRNLACVC